MYETSKWLWLKGLMWVVSFGKPCYMTKDTVASSDDQVSE